MTHWRDKDDLDLTSEDIEQMISEGSPVDLVGPPCVYEDQSGRLWYRVSNTAACSFAIDVGNEAIAHVCYMTLSRLKDQSGPLIAYRPVPPKPDNQLVALGAPELPECAYYVVKTLPGSAIFVAIRTESGVTGCFATTHASRGVTGILQACRSAYNQYTVRQLIGEHR